MAVMDETRKSGKRATRGTPSRVQSSTSTSTSTGRGGGDSGIVAVAGSDRISPDRIAEQLREVAQLSSQFHRYVGHSLSVNDTDLSAIEHLMMSGPRTPTDLARHLGISTAAVTVMVDRLTAVGHVHREPHAHDRRKVIVVPAPASVEAAFETLAPMFSGVAGITQRLSEPDREVVARFLSDVIGVFDEAIGTPAQGDAQPQFTAGE